MASMKPDTPLDYAVFQLSPKRSRCELYVSSDGNTERLAAGLLKPFVAHLKIAEEQVASAAQSVKLEVGRRKNAEVWFTKGTLERFVRFVSTPEVLELVATFDAEMSQLEAARKIYSQIQGAGDQLSGGGGGTAGDDATKKELLRALDVRLSAVQQNLSTACVRAAAAGFDMETVSELQMFADRFGAQRLNEACGKFISLCERRPNLINSLKAGTEDRLVRASYGSDMSIDDDQSSPPRQEPSTYQQPNPPSFSCPVSRVISRESSVERDNCDGNKPNTVPEKHGEDDSSAIPDSIQSSQPSRRLSVQDRINMFENKQKETSGTKPAVAKSVELRRLSSDLSSGAAAEKAVLRRWSGASDMSIDLSAEKKAEESPLYTPSPVTVSGDKIVLNSNDDPAKNYSIIRPEVKVVPSLARTNDGGMNDVSFNQSEQLFESGKKNFNLSSSERHGLKDQGQGKNLAMSSMDRAEDQGYSKEKFSALPGGENEGMVGLKYHGKLKGSNSYEELSASPALTAADEDLGSSLPQSRPSRSKAGGQLQIQNQREYSEPRFKSAVHTSVKADQKVTIESGGFGGVGGSKIREAFAARYRGVESDSLSAQQEVRSIEENEVVEENKSCPSEKVMSNSVSTVDDSGPPRMKLNRQGPSAELSKRVLVKRSESSFSASNRTTFTREVITEPQESYDSFSTPPPEQPQRIKQNQELNDELKLKANELEKLFAEHKQRVPADQINSARKGKLGDTRHEPASSLPYAKQVSDDSSQLSDNYQSAEPTASSKNMTKYDAASHMQVTDSQQSVDALSSNFYELSVSEGSRGKLYDRYMQKRDAKLKEEWSSNRVEKEARLKSMQDSLDRNRSEMKASFSGSADRRDSVSSARRRTERLRSYNSRSSLKREQQKLDYGDSDDEDEAQGKKHLPNNRSLLSSTPRASAAPLPRSAIKTSTSNYGKRRTQPENPLAQSVPNFSDLRKENTKPSSGGSKVTRSQGRNYTRSKSTTEEVAMVKEDKSLRSQSLRKSYANPIEFKEISPLDSDGVSLTPIKFDEEVLKSGGTKPFLKKGSRTGFVARASIAKQKASAVSDPVNNNDDNDILGSGPDDPVNMVKHEVLEEFETVEPEGNNIEDNGSSRHGQDNDNFINSGSENGDDTLTFSHVDRALGSQLPSEITSSFRPTESLQDWPGESPMSWNSHGQHPFSYPHEMSDVDASVDSPIGSPASWNSQSLSQMEADAARMRKKWGTAQKPMLVAHSSSNSSRKDMTSGFKRLLKFGRKTRGSDLVDWISATTSEGDDSEDGRDLANRSSEDLRKSRMGFSQAQPSDDTFNESEFFSESVQSAESSIPAPPVNFKLREDHMSGSSIKAPRSFFSLSTFRSKGSDSKPR